MQLRAEPPSIPARGVAGAGSFPLEPEAVDAWLSSLAPLDTDAGARELLRGLMHSNRLHNDVPRRRATLALFSGPLGALYESLAETARAQPLPLAPEFERARALAADLLREESIAFRSLLHDADEPLEADARLAMRALERLARLDAEAYRAIDPGTLSDAHALYAWCAAAGLAPDPTPGGPDDTDGVGARYRFVLALTLVDPQRHRARQLPLLIQWLTREAHRIELRVLAGKAVTEANRRSAGRWLVDPDGGTVPVPAGAALIDPEARLLLVDTTALLAEASRRHSVPGAAATSLPGADTLERQTFARLVATLGPPPGRRFARRAANAIAELTFGQRHICARLFYGDETSSASGAAGPDETAGATSESRVDGSLWRMVDRTASGMQLATHEARAGLAQVGELVTVHEAPADDDESALPQVGGVGSLASGERHRVLIGVVRRVRAARGGALHVGVEFLAHQAMPVSVTRDDDATAAPERALVVACRVAGKNLQTLLVPAFLYQTGDRLRATRGERSRTLELARCLQANGLYSQYVIVTPER